MPTNRLPYCASLLLAVFVLVRVNGDEKATVTLALKDGTTQKSELGWTEAKSFRVAGKSAGIANIQSIRFPDRPTTAPLRVPLLFEFQLIDHQKIYGVPIALEPDHWVIRSAWSPKLVIPKNAVAKIAHTGNQQPLWIEDFESGLSNWKLQGKPRSQEGQATSGRQALVLKSGESAERPIKQPIAAGQFAVNFFDADPVKTSGTWLELEFQAKVKEGMKSSRLEFKGNRGSYRVDPVGNDEMVNVPRTQGWHRLTIDFDSEQWLVLLDDWVVQSSKTAPGALQSVKLLCEGPDSQAMRFDDAAVLTKAQNATVAQPIDKTQDCVQWFNGDQWFGKITDGNFRSITFENKLGSKKIAWTELESLSFRSGEISQQPLSGEHVHLRVRSDLGQIDEMDGVIVSLHARELRFQHAILNESVIPTTRVRELMPRFFGDSLPIDHAPRHLGNKVQPLYAQPKPDGLAITKRFRIAAVHDQPVLCVSVRHLPGRGDGANVAETLKRGGLRTEVWLNNKLLTDLNRWIDRSSSDIRELRIPLTKDAFKTGENILGLRQVINAETGQYADCEVLSIGLELPRPRP